jgi:hypothetical protein
MALAVIGRAFRVKIAQVIDPQWLASTPGTG